MKYSKKIVLKNGMICDLRNAEVSEAEDMLRDFIKVHKETDYLASYPEESQITLEDEKQFIASHGADSKSVSVCVFVNEHIVGMACVEPIRQNIKMGHRASLAISVEEEYWNIGVGTALMEACIECCKEMGYLQLELEVVSDNSPAVSLYRKFGFIEFGRNPRGFRTKYGEWQELISMRKEF